MNSNQNGSGHHLRGTSPIVKRESAGFNAEGFIEQSIANHHEVVRRAARRHADQMENAEFSPVLSHIDTSLHDDLALAVQDPGWTVESIARPGHIGTLPSLRKTGKTTFLGNLAWCGLDGLPFLGRFDCVLDGNIAAINAEMTRDDYLWTYRNLDIINDDRLFIIHCLDEGIRLNLLNDVTCERFIMWLRAREAEWVFIDPWKNMLSWAGVDMNDNKGANDLLVRIQQIRSEAGLNLIIIPMNTPQSGEERAKGAGEVEDSADVLWRYTLVDNDDPSSMRSLSCIGRGGVSMSEVVIDWDHNTQRLLAVDGSSSDIKLESRARTAAEALELHLIKIGRDSVNTGTFDSIIKYGDSREKAAIRSKAEELGLVKRAHAEKGREVFWGIPDS
jgi:hypothetical protein